MTTDRWIRGSDQDRQSAVELISEAYAVGRLSREEFDERVTAAYSAKTHGELRDLTADLPRPAAPTGLPSETLASRRAPGRASRRLVTVTIWMFFTLVLSAGLAGLESPVAVWVAAIPVPIALLLTTRSASVGGAVPARGKSSGITWVCGVSRWPAASGPGWQSADRGRRGTGWSVAGAEITTSGTRDTPQTDLTLECLRNAIRTSQPPTHLPGP